MMFLSGNDEKCNGLIMHALLHYFLKLSPLFHMENALEMLLWSLIFSKKVPITTRKSNFISEWPPQLNDDHKMA